MAHSRAIVVFALSGALASAGAHGGVVSATGNGVVVGPPPSVALDAFESNTNAHAFNEVQDFTLLAPVTVEVTTVGLVAGLGDLSFGTLPVGLRVRSHLLHTDPVGAGIATYSGSVTFDAQVLGIIVSRQFLTLSDLQLGNPLTTYADHDARGLELGGADTIRLLPGRLVVEFSFSTSTATDSIRVITVVPAPAAGLVGAIGLIARRRRR